MYNKVFVGGTFDYFHKGHQLLIDKALEISKQVVVGITSDLYTSKHKHNISSFIDRKEFLKKTIHNNTGKISFIEIEDALEPVVSDESYQAIVVSENTKNGADLINTNRKDNQLSVLDIITLPLVLAEDGKPISSTRIKNGEIDRKGKLYIRKDWENKIFVFSEEVKHFLKKPLAPVIQEVTLESYDSLITVGDISTQAFNQKVSNHPISLIDFIVERKKIFEKIEDLGFSGLERIIDIENQPGTVNGELFFIIQKVIHSVGEQRFIVKIQGEEDLTVLPCILSAPLGWKIAYGQPHQGVVILEVTEELKDLAYDLILASKTIS